MATLLASMELVLHVNSRGSRLCKELDKLHDSGETTVSCVRVGDDRSHVVDVFKLLPCIRGNSHALVIVLAVMELLSTEEAMYLIRYGGIRIVSGQGCM
jgi:hypothetical protein